MNTLISVVVCTYNGEKFISEQLKSIIQQTLPPDEIIVSDDCSNDNTIMIAENILRKSGISYKVHKNEQNINATANFEQAMGMAAGDIIFTSDQDDVWGKNKIEIITKEFLKYDCMLVFTNAEVVDQNLNSLGFDLWHEMEIDITKDEMDNYFNKMIQGNIVTGATMAVSKKLYSLSVPFYANFFHDAWLALNATQYGKIIAIDKCLIKYRMHGNNEVGIIKHGMSRIFCDGANFLKNYRQAREKIDYEREAGELQAFYDKFFQKLSEKQKYMIQQKIRLDLFRESLKKIELKNGIRGILNMLTNGGYTIINHEKKIIMKDIIYLFLR